MTTAPSTPTIDANEAPVLPSAEDVGSICGDVWTCYVDAVTPLEVVEPLPLTGPGVAAALDVAGEWNHTVVLSLPDDIAGPAAVAMTRDGSPTPVVAHDALGELVNMIGGNVKSLMPAPSHLGSPRVSTVADLTAARHDHEPLMTVALLWNGRPFHVSILPAPVHPTSI